jgi:hypothetical protein
MVSATPRQRSMKHKGNSISRLTRKCLLWSSAAMLLGSAALQGAVRSCPLPQPPTAESYQWDFPAEVTQTLGEIERDASRAWRNASNLQMLARFPDSYSRATHAWELREAIESINRISERMCRLQEIRRVAEPWQRQSLERLMTELNAAVGSAGRSIAAFRGPRGRVELHSADYRKSLVELSQAAEAMRVASRAEWARDELTLLFKPQNVTPLPVSPTPGDE